MVPLGERRVQVLTWTVSRPCVVSFAIYQASGFIDPFSDATKDTAGLCPSSKETYYVLRLVVCLGKRFESAANAVRMPSDTSTTAFSRMLGRMLRPGWLQFVDGGLQRQHR